MKHGNHGGSAVRPFKPGGNVNQDSNQGGEGNGDGLVSELSSRNRADSVGADNLVGSVCILFKFNFRRRFGSEVVQRLANTSPAILTFAFERHFDQHRVSPVSYRLHNGIVNAFIDQRFANRSSRASA